MGDSGTSLLAKGVFTFGEKSSDFCTGKKFNNILKSVMQCRRCADLTSASAAKKPGDIPCFAAEQFKFVIYP